MYPLKQSTAQTIPVFIHDINGDAITGITDGTLTKRISKNGGAFAAMAVTLTEMENGWYDLPVSALHSDTIGILTITLTHATAKQVNLQFRVSAKLIDDLQDFSPTTDTVNANIVGIISTPISETTAGRIAGNFDSFFDNANAQTNKKVDDVGAGSSGGGFVNGSFKWSADITATDPGDGNIKIDNATYASVTAVYISALSSNGFNTRGYVTALTPNDELLIGQEANGGNFVEMVVSGTPVDNGGWFTIPVTHKDSGASIGNNQTTVTQFYYVPEAMRGTDGAALAVDTPKLTDLPANFATLIISGTGVTKSLTQGLADSFFSPEVVNGRLASNFDKFYSNNEAVTGRVLDDIGGDGAGANFVNNSYQWSTSTTAVDPGNGGINSNNTVYANITALYISELTINSFNIAGYMNALKVGDQFLIAQAGLGSSFVNLTVTGLPTDNGGWYTIPVTHLDSGALIANNQAVGVQTYFVPEAMRGTDGANTIAPDNSGMVQGFLTTALTEVTVGRIASNFDTFFENGDLATSKTVDDVGGGGAGGTDWTAQERAEMRNALGIGGAVSALGNTPLLALQSSIVTPDNAGIAANGNAIAALNNFNPTADKVVVSALDPNVITGASIAPNALDGRGNWNVGKSGYNLNQVFPTNFQNTQISAVGLVDASVEGFLGTLITEATAGRIAGNFGVFYRNSNALTVKVVDDVGGGGGGTADWTAAEKNEIRNALGVTGTIAALGRAPLLALQTSIVAAPANWSSMSINVSGQVDVIKIGGVTQSGADLGSDIANLNNFDPNLDVVQNVDTCLNNIDMRGTNGANTTAPDNVSIATILSISNKFVFTVAGRVDANAQYINNEKVAGGGVVPWSRG